ncbi:MAG: hypothetical protein ACYDEV_04375 [Acidiferrobacter sp.]
MTTQVTYSEDQIITQIRSAIYHAVKEWPTREAAQGVLDEMRYEKDTSGVRLTPIAQKALTDFRDFLRLPGANLSRKLINGGPSVVALIALARDTQRGGAGVG